MGSVLEKFRIPRTRYIGIDYLCYRTLVIFYQKSPGYSLKRLTIWSGTKGDIFLTCSKLIILVLKLSLSNQLLSHKLIEESYICLHNFSLNILELSLTP